MPHRGPLHAGVAAPHPKKITKKNIHLSLREPIGQKVDETRLNRFEFTRYSGVRGRDSGAERPAVEISY